MLLLNTLQYYNEVMLLFQVNPNWMHMSCIHEPFCYIPNKLYSSFSWFKTSNGSLWNNLLYYQMLYTGLQWIHGHSSQIFNSFTLKCIFWILFKINQHQQPVTTIVILLIISNCVPCKPIITKNTSNWILMLLLNTLQYYDEAMLFIPSESILSAYV